MFGFAGKWEWGYQQVQSSTSTQALASWPQSGENVPRTPVLPSEESAPAEEGEQPADPSDHYTLDDGTFGITQGLAGTSIRPHSRDHRSSEEYQDSGNANQVGYASSPGSQAETSSGQPYFPASKASTGIYEGYPASQSTGNPGYGYGQQYSTAGVYGAGPSYGSTAGVLGAGPSSYGSFSSSSSVPPTPDNTMRNIRARNTKRASDELDKSISAVFRLLMELLIIGRI